MSTKNAEHVNTKSTDPENDVYIYVIFYVIMIKV